MKLLEKPFFLKGRLFPEPQKDPEKNNSEALGIDALCQKLTLQDALNGSDTDT